MEGQNNENTINNKRCISTNIDDLDNHSFIDKNNIVTFNLDKDEKTKTKATQTEKDDVKIQKHIDDYNEFLTKLKMEYLEKIFKFKYNFK